MVAVGVGRGNGRRVRGGEPGMDGPESPEVTAQATAPIGRPAPPTSVRSLGSSWEMPHREGECVPFHGTAMPSAHRHRVRQKGRLGEGVTP